MCSKMAGLMVLVDGALQRFARQELIQVLRNMRRVKRELCSSTEGIV